ncbi:MAG TPA: DUF4926 domain-containing protein [Tepidisphaeraceae bacterium]|nr:DUF4926 domain-containing protein [Tepidisphaeraceae bacterium]
MTEHLQDLDVVALLRDFPEEHLERGQGGTVVLTHGGGEAYEVEFILHPGQPGSSIVATVRAEDLLKLKGFKRVSAAGVA